MEKPIFKFLWNCNGLQTAKAIFKKGIKLEDFTLTDLKTFNKAIIKSTESLHKGRHIDKQNRIESPDINSYIYGQFISTRVSRPFNGKRRLSLIDGDGKTGYSCAKRMKFEPLLHTIYKN